jgi:hypothetical protein
MTQVSGFHVQKAAAYILIFGGCLSAMSTKTSCVGSYIDSDGEERERQWMTPLLHFDDFPHSIVSVTEITFGSGSTMDFLYAMMDITAVCPFSSVTSV